MVLATHIQVFLCCTHNW